MGISKHLSIITLSVNDFNSPVKGHGLSDKKNNFLLPPEQNFSGKDTHRLPIKRWKIIYPANRN